MTQGDARAGHGGDNAADRYPKYTGVVRPRRIAHSEVHKAAREGSA